jgi:hypothetical protein
VDISYSFRSGVDDGGMVNAQRQFRYREEEGGKEG